MPGLYVRTTKITNALGRARYISDDLRQEEIVLHKKEMDLTTIQFKMSFIPSLFVVLFEHLSH